MAAQRSNNKKKSLSERQFPGRLHSLLEYIEANSLEHVMAWVLNGRGFIVRDPDRLVDILPTFFSQTKYRSFRRQLNMWHFERIEKGPNKGAFRRQLNMWHFERIEKGPNKGAFIHPYFVRGNRDLCSLMSRNVSLRPRRESSFGSSSSSVSSATKGSLEKKSGTFNTDSSSTLVLPPTEEDDITGISSRLGISPDMLEPNPIKSNQNTTWFNLKGREDEHVHINTSLSRMDVAVFGGLPRQEEETGQNCYLQTADCGGPVSTMTRNLTQSDPSLEPVPFNTLSFDNSYFPVVERPLSNFEEVILSISDELSFS